LSEVGRTLSTVRVRVRVRVRVGTRARAGARAGVRVPHLEHDRRVAAAVEPLLLHEYLHLGGRGRHGLLRARARARLRLRFSGSGSGSVSGSS